MDEKLEFSAWIELAWLGYKMDAKTLRSYIKQLLEDSGAIRVDRVEVTAVDE